MKQFRDGYRLIFRPWIRLKNGKVIYARWYGKRAFAIWVKEGAAPQASK